MRNRSAGRIPFMNDPPVELCTRSAGVKISESRFPIGFACVGRRTDDPMLRKVRNYLR